MRGHRRRLPPGRDPHHPVRRGAAAGARGARRRHLQRRSRRPSRPACARSSPSSSASVYGLAEEFPTAENHHPYANDTLYGAAKAFNEGLLRSFHAMYGPRLRRAALLQRLRPAHGRPRPLHRGARALDGAHRRRRAAADPRRRPADDGLRLHRRHRARQRAGRRRPTSPTTSSTSPAAPRRACSSWPQMLLAGDGLRPRRSSTARSAPSTASRAAWPTPTPRASELGFEAEVDLEEGLTRLVEWWRGERAGEPAEPIRTPGEGVVMEVPFARPYLRGDEGDAVAAGDRLRLGLPGPARARVRGAPSPSASAPPTRWRRPTARPRCSSRSTSSGVGPGDEVIVPVAVVHRHGQRGLAVRRDAGLRRRRPAHLQPRPGRRRARDHRAHEGDHAGPPARPAGRHGRLPRARRPPRPRDRRGRRLRDRRALQGRARSARSARWPASRCTRAR